MTIEATESKTEMLWVDRVEWRKDATPYFGRVNFSARKTGNLWVARQFGVYADTDTVLTKIHEIVKCHGEDVESIRLTLEVKPA